MYLKFDRRVVMTETGVEFVSPHICYYGDGGASERAAAEAARQAQIERDRLAAEAIAAKEEADRRKAEEDARWQKQYDQQVADAAAQRKILEDGNAATLKAQQDVENQRKAERDADLARQEKERVDAETHAKSNAATLSQYANDRQGIVSQAQQNISAAFAPYDDNYYNKYATDYTSYYKPQVEQQYDDAKRATTFGFADKGSLDSTAAARAFGRLDQTRTQSEADLAQKATSAASTFRNTVDSQRASLLNSIFSATSAAPPITVDNIGDANTSLRQLTSALSSPVNLAYSAASTVAPPTYGSLTNPFSVPTGNGAAALRTTVAGGGSNGAYSTAGGSSGRLVN